MNFLSTVWHQLLYTLGDNPVDIEKVHQLYIFLSLLVGFVILTCVARTMRDDDTGVIIVCGLLAGAFGGMTGGAVLYGLLGGWKITLTVAGIIGIASIWIMLITSGDVCSIRARRRQRMDRREYERQLQAQEDAVYLKYGAQEVENLLSK